MGEASGTWPIGCLGINPRILTAVGIVLGAGAGIYLVYLRFGKGEGNGGGA